jgi:hypothetical protein
MTFGASNGDGDDKRFDEVEREVIRLSYRTKYGQSTEGIVAFIRLHEKDKHSGKPCMDERVNAVAYIAHHLGMAADDDHVWEFIRTVVKMIYEVDDG